QECNALDIEIVTGAGHDTVTHDFAIADTLLAHLQHDLAVRALGRAEKRRALVHGELVDETVIQPPAWGGAKMGAREAQALGGRHAMQQPWQVFEHPVFAPVSEATEWHTDPLHQPAL